ncbi:MAG: hypothetical protein NZ822_02945, partial [Patescibacteria group bacterium]|nr:hypothetical protein [Patescibacteria group bacterium]
MTINDIFQNLIRNFDQREQDLIKRRYGINPEGKEESLEKIGESYSVSRERIRQLQNKLANKINSLVNYSLEIDNIVEHVRKNYFGQLGFRKEETLKDLLKRGENLDDYHFYIFRFFSIFHKKIFYSFKDKNFHNFFCDSQETSFKVKELLENTYHHFVKINSTLKEEEVIEVILNNIKEHFSLETHSKEEIFDLLTTIKHLAKNPFGLWGLKTHSHISPKSLSEKIYLILKTKNQPLHFKA